MGTTRESKVASKAKASAGTVKKKKTAVKAAGKSPAAPKAAKKAAAKKAVAKKTVAKASPVRKTKAAVAKAVPRAAAPAKAAPRRKAASAAEAPPLRKVAAPKAVAPPPPAPPAPAARDPREERRARLEERLAQRSAQLREQQQQRASVAPAPAAPPRREPEARGPQPLRDDARPAPAAMPQALRPDLPFDPRTFRGPAAAPQAAAPAEAPPPSNRPEAGAEEGAPGGRRRRRRRRRRGGGSDAAAQGAETSGSMPVQAPRPAPPPPPPQPQQPGDAMEGEGGGRRKRRRRRRRRGGGGEGGDDHQQPPQARPQPPRGAGFVAPPPRQASPWASEEFDGSSRRGRRQGRGRRDGGGPLPWDPDREAPAVNILPDRDPFSELVSIDPEERIDLETDSDEMAMRVVDLVTPFGKGQRALIVAPPKTGKTTLLMQLARAITENHPEMELIVMLVDERPEEVTAFRRAGYGEVLASSNDEPTWRHLKLTQHVLDVAKRRVIAGKDVCILLDSITRMARAHNVASAGNRTLSGGLDSRALERPKRFFGAARKILNGGSLTVLATALIDTGSRMDEVIFQEFKGTGNAELQLDRRLAERRIWPAIDIQRSGTRKEEKLFEKDEFEGVVALRRALSGKPPAEAMQLLLARLEKYKTNREFLLDVARKAASAL